jgi:hypothetical protein
VLTFNTDPVKHVLFFSDSNKVYVYSSRNSSLGDRIDNDTLLFTCPDINEFEKSPWMKKLSMQNILKLIFV